MKKNYNSPDLEITQLQLKDYLCTSAETPIIDDHEEEEDFDDFGP